jgi:hypothetical protein
MPPHPVLVDTLCKFHVQLHQLTLNAIVQISKFIWAVTSCGGHPTVDVFAQHYELHYQHKKVHLEGCTTTLAAQFGYITFHPSRYRGQARLRRLRTRMSTFAPVIIPKGPLMLRSRGLRMKARRLLTARRLRKLSLGHRRTTPTKQEGRRCDFSCVRCSVALCEMLP